MSWTDDEIDSIFKEIPHLKPSPYQDSFFDEIEPRLPQKRSKKGLFWVLGSALVALMTTFINSDFTPAKERSSDKKQASNTMAAQRQAVALELNPSNTAETANPVNSGQSSESQFAQESREESNAFRNAAEPAQNPLSVDMNEHYETFSITDMELLAVNDENENENESENESEIVEGSSVAHEVESERVKPEFISPLITSGLRLLHPEPFTSNSQKEIQALYLPMLTKKHYLTLEAGTGFTENFIKMENSSQKPMPTANLGLSYQYRSKKLFYSAGLNWMNFSPNSLVLNRESKVYGFEVSHYTQNIDYKWITMVEMPLSIGKHFRNHTFSIGVAPSLVLGSMVDFTKTENGVVTEDSRIYGNMLGLKRYSVSINLAYDLRIARNLDFGVKVSNMLINPLDETRFVGQLNKNPFQAQITLKKHFRIK
jgi:hypothetical protein